MKKFIVLLFCLSFGFYSCMEEGTSNSSNSDELEQSDAKEKKKPNAIKQIKAPISSPEKMFGYIHDQGISYSKDLMNAPAKAQNYVTPQQKALNFGIYTTDLAYAAAYQDIESTVDLYKTVKRLSAELDIAEVVNAEMVEQMQANMENPDSLAVVAGQAYYQAVDFLEDNRQSGKLALMSVGGWMESLYITMNAIEGEKNATTTKQKVAEQKKIFQNLHAYLEKNQTDLGVEATLQSLQPVADIYKEITAEETGGQLKINDTQYEQLKQAVSNYRNQLITVE